METIISTIISVLATFICTVLAVIFIPAVTVLLETLQSVRKDRDRFMALVDEFHEIGKQFLDSKTDDECRRRRMDLFRIDRVMGEVSESLRPYVPEFVYRELGSFRHALSRFWETPHSLLARNSGQWSERQDHFQMLKRAAGELKATIEQTDKNYEFARAIWKEIKDIYYSIWKFIVHSIRQCITTRKRRAHED